MWDSRFMEIHKTVLWQKAVYSVLSDIKAYINKFSEVSAKLYMQKDTIRGSKEEPIWVRVEHSEGFLKPNLL